MVSVQARGGITGRPKKPAEVSAEFFAARGAPRIARAADDTTRASPRSACGPEVSSLHAPQRVAAAPGPTGAAGALPA
eukprot:scaffold3709_cov68-Phaeocystis_antarctica.AAC.5